MTTSYPVAVTSLGSAPPSVYQARPISPAIPNAGSWRYTAGAPRRRLIAVAALSSIAFHAFILLGFRGEAGQATKATDEPVTMIRLAIPDLKELEEPEVVATEDTSIPTDLATLVPMQADLPQLARPNDFVQAINFTSLLEKPDFSNVDIAVIPETFRGGKKLAESIGKVFSLADLDRIPEPVLQNVPLYPFLLRRDGIEGRVQVEFVVDVDGRVRDATPVASTHSGFNDAAVIAVSKWKFRPGMKEGRKVNTRMAVPVVFTLEDEGS
jgi:protein TonB